MLLSRAVSCSRTPPLRICCAGARDRCLILCASLRNYCTNCQCLLVHAPLTGSVVLSYAASQELLCRRTWPVSAHPKWLVFEAESGLQIRPLQHATAQYLMKHPGACTQLNMVSAVSEDARMVPPLRVCTQLSMGSAVRENVRMVPPCACAHS
jgi:hypothetical protein